MGFQKKIFSGKRTYFMVFGCVSKNVVEGIFWCLACAEYHKFPMQNI
jgi:hypothetical protein